jgi:HEAT repeat protein
MRDMKRQWITTSGLNPWRWSLWGLAVVLPVSLMLAIWLRLAPRHEGRTLSEWLSQPWDERVSDEDTATALRAMGPRVLPTLLDWLQQRDSRTRQWIAMQADKQTLFDLNFEGADMRRGTAVAGLRLLGTNAASAVPTLAKLIDDPELGGAALSGLAAIGVPAWPVLLSGLTNRLPAVRSLAVVLLASDPFIDLPGTMPVLLRMFQDDNPQVQMSAINTLAQCERHQELVHPAIAEVAADTNSPSRAAAINVLTHAKVDPSISLPVFLTAMQNGLPDVRRRAVVGLAQIESEEVMEPLIRALNDSEPAVRAKAATTVGRFSGQADRIIPLLHRLLTNDYPVVRGSAANGLGKFGPTARVVVPDLLLFYEERGPVNPPVFRQTVARALLAIDPAAAVRAGIKQEDYPPLPGRSTNAVPLRSRRGRIGAN